MVPVRLNYAPVVLAALMASLSGCSTDDSDQSVGAPRSAISTQSSLTPLQADLGRDFLARRPTSPAAPQETPDDLPLWPPSPTSSPSPAPTIQLPHQPPTFDQTGPATAPPLLPSAPAPESSVPDVAPAPFTPASPPSPHSTPAIAPALGDPNPLRTDEPRQFVPEVPAAPAIENPLRDDTSSALPQSPALNPNLGPPLNATNPPNYAPFIPSSPATPTAETPLGSGGLLPHAPESNSPVLEPAATAPMTVVGPAAELPATELAAPANQPFDPPVEAATPRPRQRLPRVSSALPQPGQTRSIPKPSLPSAASSLTGSGTYSGASGLVAGSGSTPTPSPMAPPRPSPPKSALPATEEPPLPATNEPSTTLPEPPGAPAPFVAPPATAEPSTSAPPELPPFQIPAQAPPPSSEIAEPAAIATPEEAPATAAPVEEIPSFGTPENASAVAPDEPAASSVIEQTVAVQPAPADSKTDEPFETVRVFYGTDRQPILVHQDSLLKRVIRFAPATILILLSAIGIGVVFTARKVTWMIGTTLLLVLSVLATWHSVRETIALANLAALEEPQYSAERSYRGQIERGICEVSIPKSHRAGELEGPSILRLEVQEDPRKHITLRKTTRLNDDVFYEQLRAQVASSPERELLVFVHGFNVTFEDAARRTGQMAKDLKLQGAPVFFSWPADKYFLLTYGKDETNVAWATPHLKEFLLELVAETDAKAINLVAHSMGSRALTTALREIDLQFREDARKFNQVVLAAPDIDADDFRDNIAPSIQRTARQVTLYASSNDIALSASRFFHRNARAGDTSRGLVIVAGMHTIDVSAIDGGPWGHSYYGASDPVLRDLHLLLGSLPPERRTWLKPSELDGQTYWAFRPLGTAATPAMVTPR